MRTINFQSTTVETFYDPETNKYEGFAGTIKIFESSIYIDTRTGEGYGEAIIKLEPYVNYITRKYNFSSLGYSLADTKQHIIMRILEGIPKYDPNKNTTLSTFLYMRVERRIITEMRNINADAKNPTTLKTSFYSVTCECGRKFMADANKDDPIKKRCCDGCGGTLENAKIYSLVKPPELLQDVKIRYVAEKNRTTMDDILSENSFDIPLIYGLKPQLGDLIVTQHDFDNWIGAEDAKTQKLVELVCFKDYSVKSAAEVVGVSHTGASNTLKKLSRKKKIRDMLGR